jgi:urease accessory protein
VAGILKRYALRIVSIRWFTAAAVAAVGLATAPAVCDAHLVSTGLGPFYDGVYHLALTPEILVPVIAIALLVGLKGPVHSRWALFVLPTAWLLGAIFSLSARDGPPMALAAILFILLGGLVAADPPLPSALTTALAAASGVMLGAFNSVAMSQSGLTPIPLLGTATVVFVVVAIGASEVISLRAAWTRIAVRVAGSWIAATGLLLLGWSLRTHR